MQLDNPIVTWGEHKVKSPVAPFVINEGHTVIPVRAVAELLGCGVYYDENTREITIDINGVI